MALDKVQMRDDAAQKLGILRIGQALQDTDRVRMERAYDEVYADLKKEGTAVWSSSGNVPDELIGPVGYLMALNASDTYSVSDARMARIVARTGLDGNLAKREIRRLVTPNHESMEDAKDY